MKHELALSEYQQSLLPRALQLARAAAHAHGEHTSSIRFWAPEQRRNSKPPFVVVTYRDLPRLGYDATRAISAADQDARQIPRHYHRHICEAYHVEPDMSVLFYELSSAALGPRQLAPFLRSRHTVAEDQGWRYSSAIDRLLLPVRIPTVIRRGHLELRRA